MRIYKAILIVLFTLAPQYGLSQTLGIGISNEFPLQLSAESRLTLPYHLFTRLNLGAVVDPYIEVANAMAEGLDLYSENTSNLIEEILPGSGYFEIAIGYEDIVIEGLFAELGYSFVFGGSGTSARSLLEAVLDTSLPFLPTVNNIDVSGDVHSITFHIGYKWEFMERFNFLAKAGFNKPLGGSTSLSVDNIPAFITDPISRALDNFMDNVYEDVWYPTISISLLYTFEVFKRN